MDEYKQIHESCGILTKLKATLQRRRLGELLVIHGLITPNQLRAGLVYQKKEKIPLGQVFVKQGLLSNRDIRFLLYRQRILRLVAAMLFFVTSMTLSGQKKARADILKEVPAIHSMLVPVKASTTSTQYVRLASYPALFGSQEKESGNLRPFTKWTGMFDRFDREMLQPASSRLIREWRADLEQFRGMSLKSMAIKVNNLVNRSPYILDNKNWGKSDYWATPTEFLRRGGDCEDFAIAKYMALRMLGVPEERLRVVIVHDNQKNIPHAVLVVYTDQDAWILDNQVKTLVSTGSGLRYRPIFSINRTSWWLHTTPEATMVASVN